MGQALPSPHHPGPHPPSSAIPRCHPQEFQRLSHKLSGHRKCIAHVVPGRSAQDRGERKGSRRVRLLGRALGQACLTLLTLPLKSTLGGHRLISSTYSPASLSPSRLLRKMPAPVEFANRLKEGRALGFEVWEGCPQEEELGRQGAGQSIYRGFSPSFDHHPSPSSSALCKENLRLEVNDQ